VFVFNVADGCIPSDVSAGSADQLEEERRLFYVAMTRAKQHLHLVQPLRFFRTQQHRHGDGHVLAPRTRFIPDHFLELFDRRAWPEGKSDETPIRGAARVDVAARLRDMWHDAGAKEASMAFFIFPEDAHWNPRTEAVEFSVAIGRYEGTVRAPAELFTGC